MERFAKNLFSATMPDIPRKTTILSINTFIIGIQISAAFQLQFLTLNKQQHHPHRCA
jgi:hypothetical protein